MLKPNNLQNSLQEASQRNTVDDKKLKPDREKELLEQWEMIQGMMKTNGWKLLEGKIGKEMVRLNGQILNGSKEKFDKLQGHYTGVGFVMDYIRGLQSKVKSFDIKS